MNIVSGRRIIPVEAPEPLAEPDTATILYNQILYFGNAIATDNTIFPSELIPARHVFFKERAVAFGLFLVTCCFGNVDLGTDITYTHRDKLSETKVQFQVETYMADLMRAFLSFKAAHEKARKKHRFDLTAALNEMIPFLLGELNAEKSPEAASAAREHIFDLLDVLNTHEI